jgi:hypothetical protein
MLSQLLKRLAGPALTLGGLLWITIHVIVVIGGLMTGKLVPAIPATHQPLLTHIYYFLLPLSYLILCVGLLGAFAWLDGRARKLGITCFVLASIATVTSIILLIFLAMSATSLNGSLGVLVPLVNALNGLSTLSASLVLGCALLRVHMLPRPYAWILIVIGIVTLPILLLTPLPIGPTWATDTVAFFLSGIGYTMVGLRILVERKRMDEHTKDVSINVVAQAR